MWAPQPERLGDKGLRFRLSGFGVLFASFSTEYMHLD